MTKLTHPTSLPMPGRRVACGAPQLHRHLRVYEAGLRPARALPCALQASGHVISSDGSFRIDFANDSRTTAVFHVLPAFGNDVPRSYTVEHGRRVSGHWPVLAAGEVEYDFAVHGPGGFLRHFMGSVGGDRRAVLDVGVAFDERCEAVTLRIANRADQAAAVCIADQYSGGAKALTLLPTQAALSTWELRTTFGWYDLRLTVEDDSSFQIRLAGDAQADAQA